MEDAPFLATSRFDKLLAKHWAALCYFRKMVSSNIAINNTAVSKPETTKTINHGDGDDQKVAVLEVTHCSVAEQAVTMSMQMVYVRLVLWC